MGAIADGRQLPGRPPVHSRQRCELRQPLLPQPELGNARLDCPDQYEWRCSMSGAANSAAGCSLNVRM